MTATSSKMARIEPREPEHVTLAATADTSDLSAPRCNWIIGQAEKVKKRFVDYIESKQGVTVGKCPDRHFTFMYADEHGPEIVADVSGCDDDTTNEILSAIGTLEEWFAQQVQDAGF